MPKKFRRSTTEVDKLKDARLSFAGQPKKRVYLSLMYKAVGLKCNVNVASTETCSRSILLAVFMLEALKSSFTSCMKKGNKAPFTWREDDPSARIIRA